MSETPYVTTKRPTTEPYFLWAERRRRQKKALKEYLRKGTVLWTGKFQGPYAKPICEQVHCRGYRPQAGYSCHTLQCGYKIPRKKLKEWIKQGRLSTP